MLANLIVSLCNSLGRLCFAEFMGIDSFTVGAFMLILTIFLTVSYFKGGKRRVR